MRFDDLEIDAKAREVRLGGDIVHLTRTEFELLQALVDHPRQALTRAQIIDMVWGGAWFGEPHLVSVHMSNLRKKIADKTRVPPLIHTLHGVGYRFDGHVHHRPPHRI